jgi:hypothetical protein
MNANKHATRLLTPLCLVLCAPAMPVKAAPVAAGLATVTVIAVKRAYHNTPVSVLLPVPKNGRLPEGYLQLSSEDGKQTLRAQITPEGKKARLTFLLDDLPQGEKRAYHLGRIVFIRAPDTLVSVKTQENDLQVDIGRALFTRYTTKSGPNKPFFYPILTPEGQPITRRWPMEKETGETRDHPHHRGLWFTHGDVNGIDFWSEEKKAGRTVAVGFENLVSGWVFGGFQTKTEWRAPDDHLIATDMRIVKIYSLPNGDRLLDFEIALKPADQPLVFGDTKEGMFGLRVADTLAPARKEGGHILNAKGDQDGAAWGKAAEWVDYWGPIHGQTYGVALFDHPKNLRHPQTWHARDYGLFTINPFGLHDFKLGPAHAGDFTLPANQTLTLRYRLLFHKGDAKTAAVAEQYADYADPPQVEAHWQ